MKEGDIVRLKSGGPLMTVKYSYPGGGKSYVQCNWFVKGECKFFEFSENQLKEVKREGKI